MDTKQVIARFEAERQALAMLKQPNIAQVYDAGMTPLCRPYFVMERVKGLSLTQHCDQEKLGIEERLRLFLQVCEAVQQAHQKAIIHRDIKPSKPNYPFSARSTQPGRTACRQAKTQGIRPVESPKEGEAKEPVML